MKKSILVFALALGSFASYSFAAPVKSTKEAPGVRAFKKDFTAAREIQFENFRNFTKVSFVENGEFLYAYYSNGGELLAVTRNITSSQLSLNARKALKDNYAGYWITELFEVSANDETSYYVTLENAGQQIILKAEGTGAWQFVRTISK